MNQPAISVVLPVHNGERYLEAAISSILSQSFRDFELVIGDDGSTDGTNAIIAKFAREDERIRAIRRATKSGVAAAANWVVGEARAPLVAIAHADDLSLPDRLMRQRRLMLARPDCVLTGAVASGMDWHGDRAHAPNLWRLAFPGVFAPMPHSSIMFRHEAFDRLGGYRIEAEYWEDLDLYWRMARHGKLLVSARPLTIYRYSQTSIREREVPGAIEHSLETMYRSAAVIGNKSSSDIADETSSPKIHPRIFVARSWSKVWAGERTALLPQLLARGRLRPNLDTIQSLGFVGWASISPRSLRAVLRNLTRLRNVIARIRLKNVEFREWQPLRGVSGPEAER